MQQRLIIGLAVLALMLGCTRSDDAGREADGPTTEPAMIDGHSSRDSVDWPGSYHGITPCADCDGIETTVSLAAEGNFERSRAYLGKSQPPFVDAGRFGWDDAGRVITLEAEGDTAQQYQVGENILFHLDQSGQRIEGELAPMYLLDKVVSDSSLEDRKWLLVELFGEPVILAEGSSEAFLEFDSAERQASGNNTCNNFFGAYILKNGMRIRFSPQMGSTMRACPDMDNEGAFMSVLGQADNYAIADGVLSLNRARMAPLARFTQAPND